MQIHRVEVWIAILENELNFDSDRQHQHRHEESVIESLLGLVLYVELGPYRRDTDEHLLHVVHIQRQGVQMPKHIPIGQVRNKTDQF